MGWIGRTAGILVRVLLFAAGPAAAQDTSRPLRLVVSFPPGGGVDVVARLFADRMSALLGQTVVVENRGGASGIIAGKQVASAEPDGRQTSIAMFDLDGFKSYNDTFGHAAGDTLLQRLAAALRAVLTAPASVYRMGGDEFCALLPGGDDGEADRGEGVRVHRVAVLRRCSHNSRRRDRPVVLAAHARVRPVTAAAVITVALESARALI